MDPQLLVCERGDGEFDICSNEKRRQKRRNNMDRVRMVRESSMEEFRHCPGKVTYHPKNELLPRSAFDLVASNAKFAMLWNCKESGIRIANCLRLAGTDTWTSISLYIYSYRSIAMAIYNRCSDDIDYNYN